MNNRPILSVNTSWRTLPRILEVLREVPIDIRRAYIQKNASTLFLREGSPYMTSKDLQTYILKIEEDGMPQAFEYGKIELPIDSQVVLYNVPKLAYTTLEFYCKDRIGLLSDLLQHMSSLDVDMHEAHITTLNDYAHNIFHLQKRGKQLDHNQMAYVRNIFEHVLKPRFEVRCD